MFTKTAYKTNKVKSAHHSVFARQNATNYFVPAVQAKLQVGAADSIFETEADRLADQVVQNRSIFHNSSFIPQQQENFKTSTHETTITEENPEELANAILPPVEGEQDNPEETAEKNPPEEKQEAEQPATPDEKVEIPEPLEAVNEKGDEKLPGEEKIKEEAPEKEESEEVTDEEAAVFQAEPNMEPVAPIEITPALSASVSQMLDTGEAETEPEAEKGNDYSGEMVQAKYSTSNPEDPDPEKDQLESQIQNSVDGHSLPQNTRQFMEGQFQADFSKVRIHTGAKASRLNNKIQARAFTHKNNIYFNQGQYDPASAGGQHLLAHELTHTVQQGGAIQRKSQISSTAPKVQRLGIGDALDYFADKAYHIPGYRMFTIILGVNPITMSSVDRSPGNILRAMVEFLPGGYLITQALETHGIFTRISSWFKEQMDSLGISGSSIRAAINKFLDSLSWSDIFDLGGVWSRAKAIFITPINRLIAFGKSLVKQIMEWVKEAILRPLAMLAEGTPAYDLLRVVLGSDPMTGEPYPPTAENLIGGFMKLIGQEEIWENIKKGNAIERAFSWFQGALSGLMGFVTSIPSTIINILKSLTWDDIILVPKAFVKIERAFLSIAVKFMAWAGGTVLSLLEILFSVVAPAVVPWLKKAGAAFNSILQNPVGFIGNLVQAAKNGFMKFARNIALHLKAALINWLLGALAGSGLYIPQSLEIKELIKFVLSALAISWANLRLKMVKHLGEPAVKAVETGFEIVQLLLEKGPIALWERLKEQIADLKSMVIGEITSWVVTKVVMKGITKLVSSLNPAGAVIQAILFIYDTITFLIEKISQIARVGMAVLNSISTIASGAIQSAVQKVEQTLAGMLNLSIGFLAKFLGLGKISDKIVSIVKKIQQKIDKALDHVVGWIVGKAKKFLKKIVKKDDDAKHGQYASEAVSELSRPSAMKVYKEVNEEKSASAKTLENKYNGMLKKGIKMKIIFESEARDRNDKDLDFTVIIAPNTTTKKGSSNFKEYTQKDVPTIKIVFKFDQNAGYAKIPDAREEYERQLKDMQDHLNNLSVGEWKGNRDRFLEISEIRKKSEPERSDVEQSKLEEYDKEDRTARENARKALAESYAENKYYEYLKLKGSWEEFVYKNGLAEEGSNKGFENLHFYHFIPPFERKAYYKEGFEVVGREGFDRAALHLDKVGGGNTDQIIEYGNASINSAIGSTLSIRSRQSEKQKINSAKKPNNSGIQGLQELEKFIGKLDEAKKTELKMKGIFKLIKR